MDANASVPRGETKLTAGQVVRIVIPFAVIMAFSHVASWGSFQDFQKSWFFHDPSDSVPWYFIGQDLIDVAWSFSCSLAAIVFCVAAAPKLGAAAWVAVSSEALSFTQSLSDGVNLLLHTSHVWDPARASTTWASYESYAQSQSIPNTVAYVLLLPIFVWCLMRCVRDVNAGKI